MGCRVRSILAQIKSDLQGIDGTGSYNFDISGSNQVVMASAMNPIRVPCVYVYADTEATAQTPSVTVLTQYDRTLTVNIIGYLSNTSDNPEEMHLRTWDLASDIKAALEADRSLTSGSPLCDDLELRVSSIDGEQVGRPSLGIAVVVLTVKFRQDSGSHN